MPADLLLPLFALTLLANAILVGAAIRGMRRGRSDSVLPPSFAPARGRIEPASPAASAPTAPPAPEAAADDPEARPDPPRRDDDRSAKPSGNAVRTTPSPAAPVAAGPDAAEPAARGRTRAGSGQPRARSAAPAETDSAGRAAPPTRRSRRRFSLPHLDDDHEKVSRSIETFLGGSDGSSAAAGDAGGGGATTVAIVAIDGLRPSRRRTRRAAEPGLPAGDPGGEPQAPDVDAAAMVERTLRETARGGDVVSVGRGGRFRVVLPGTGELAARAYLRRVRAGVDPILEACPDPLRLVIATATVLGGPVDDAIRTAERRMVVLREAANRPLADPLRGAGGESGSQPQVGLEDDAPDPRAAAD